MKWVNNNKIADQREEPLIWIVLDFIHTEKNKKRYKKHLPSVLKNTKFLIKKLETRRMIWLKSLCQT